MWSRRDDAARPEGAARRAKMASDTLYSTRIIESNDEAYKPKRVVADGGCRPGFDGHITLLWVEDDYLTQRTRNVSVHCNVRDAEKIRRQLGRAIRAAKQAEKAAHKAANQPRKPAMERDSRANQPLNSAKLAVAVEATRPGNDYTGIKDSVAKEKALEKQIAALKAQKAAATAAKPSPKDAVFFISEKPKGVTLADIATLPQAVQGKLAQHFRPTVATHAGVKPVSLPSDSVFYITK